MIGIGSTDFEIGVDPLGHDALELYSLSLFESWESWLAENLRVPDYSVRLEVEEGSLKGKGKLFATLGAVYLGIGQYGSFRAGVREIAHDARAAGSFLVERALEPLSVNAPATSRSRRSAGRIGELEGIFEKVERGEIEPDPASDLAVALFADDPDAPPAFLETLRQSVRGMPRYPHQLTLQLPSAAQGPVVQKLDSTESPTKRKPKSLPPVVPPERYRVEIWRESKNGRRRFKIHPLT